MDINSYILLHTTGNLYWKDTNGYYLGCNLEFAKIAKLKSPQEIIGKSDKDLFSGALSEELIKKLFEIDQYVIKNNVEKVSEETGVDDQGNIAYYLTKKIPLKDDQGNIIGVIGNSINITPRKKEENELRAAKEKAEAANKAKTEFIDNMRHDTRTPLSCIIGLAKLLESKENNPEKKDLTRAIIDASESLMDFVNEVLDFSLTESGATPLRKINFNLKQLCHELFTLMNVIATQKEILFTIDYGDNIPEFLQGDRQRLFRILINLISNALKFTNEGFVKLILKSNKKSKEKITLDISIIDSGIGIPAEKLDSIFQKFTRLNSSYNGIYKGYGLGLSIVRKFVQDLKGTITVKSTVNAGSEFRCLLPFNISPQEENYAIKNKLKTNNNSSKKNVINFRFLIVEDNAIAQLLGKALITDLGWHAEIASDAKEAWQHVNENHYDMILMDIGLPETDGIKLSKAFREVGIKCPIILVTAHKQQDYGELSQDKCITAFIQKPLTQEILKTLVDKHIKARHNYLVEV